MVPAFGAGLQVLAWPAILARAIGWSVGVWGVAGVVFLLVGASLGLNLPLWSPLLLSFVVCLGIAVPSSPGFIGVLEGACVVGLALVGFGGPEALAFGILYHLTQIVPLLVLGSFFAIREHLTPEILRGTGTANGGGERKK